MARLNDVGTIIEMTVTDLATEAALNIAAATTKQIIFEKPDGDSVTKKAVLTGDGTDGKMQYTIVDGDLDQVGEWNYQGFVIVSTGEWYTDIHTLMVERVL
jgi:hypothetical protein